MTKVLVADLLTIPVVLSPVMVSNEILPPKEVEVPAIEILELAR